MSIVKIRVYCNHKSVHETTSQIQRQEMHITKTLFKAGLKYLTVLRCRGAHGQPCTVLLAKSWSRVWSPQWLAAMKPTTQNHLQEGAGSSSANNDPPKTWVGIWDHLNNPWKVWWYCCLRCFSMQQQKDPNLIQLWWNYSDVLWGWLRDLQLAKLLRFNYHDDANKSNRTLTHLLLFTLQTISANMQNKTATHMKRLCLEDSCLFSPNIRFYVGLRASIFDGWNRMPRLNCIICMYAVFCTNEEHAKLPNFNKIKL